mmetsp:Transcript_37530/g.120639  ORF Transcript_37530/g.120639 Transcript_37530/m.120639 type:complete len:288 (-) Transcript_37530:1494-2357(-)
MRTLKTMRMSLTKTRMAPAIRRRRRCPSHRQRRARLPCLVRVPTRRRWYPSGRRTRWPGRSTWLLRRSTSSRPPPTPSAACGPCGQYVGRRCSRRCSCIRSASRCTTPPRRRCTSCSGARSSSAASGRRRATMTRLWGRRPRMWRRMSRLAKRPTTWPRRRSGRSPTPPPPAAPPPLSPPTRLGSAASSPRPPLSSRRCALRMLSQAQAAPAASGQSRSCRWPPAPPASRFWTPSPAARLWTCPSRGTHPRHWSLTVSTAALLHRAKKKRTRRCGGRARGAACWRCG